MHSSPASPADIINNAGTCPQSRARRVVERAKG
jgi:hypothetical protein